MLQLNVNNQIISFEWKSYALRVAIFINATEMATPYDNKTEEFLGLESTRLFNVELIKYYNMELNPDPLYEIKNNGDIWLDSRLALELARWLSISLYLKLMTLLSTDDLLNKIYNIN